MLRVSLIGAGDNVPFSLFVYMPFLKEKLNIEIENYIKKVKGQVYYIDDSQELAEELTKLGNKFNKNL